MDLEDLGRLNEADLKMLAHDLGAYHSALLQSGLKRDEATGIVLGYQEALLLRQITTRSQDA